MADPEVVRVMLEFRDSLLDSESAQFEAMARAWVGVERELESAITALVAEVNEIGGVPTPAQLQRLDRYIELLRQTRQVAGDFAKDIEPGIIKQQRDFAELGIKAAETAMLSVGIAAGFNKLPKSAVAGMVGLLQNGSPLASLLSDTWADAAMAMTSTLIRNTALGINPRATARAMQKASNAALFRMMRIARTEQLRVFRESGRQAYIASGRVVGYKRLSAKDNRVCAACLIADGQFYPLGDVMPTHPQCRCTAVPVLRNTTGPTWLYGKDWLVQQPEQTQLDILGKGRFEAWKADLFDLDDIPARIPDSTWGDSLQPKTLSELLQIAA